MNKEPLFQVGEDKDEEKKSLFGIDPELSLQSVNFAPGENQYLNEHYEQRITNTEEGEG